MKYPTALECYIRASGFVMSEVEEPDNYFVLLNEYFAPLRFFLACRVCNQMLQKPMTPDHTVCKHTVCEACIGGKMKLKPSCGWCQNYENFVKNHQLESLMKCYSHLCQYVLNSSYFRAQKEGIELRTANRLNGEGLPADIRHICESRDNVLGLLVEGRCQPSRSGVPINNEEKLQATSVDSVINVVEGSDKSQKEPPSLTNGVPSPTRRMKRDGNSPRHKTKSPKKGRKKGKSIEIVGEQANGSVLPLDPLCATPSPVRQRSQSGPGGHSYSSSPKRALFRQTSAGFETQKLSSSLSPEVSFQGSNAFSLVRSQQTEFHHSPGRMGKSLSLDSVPENRESSGGESTKKRRRSSHKLEKKGCGCGTATANPGKLTCYGQRCPCYSNHNPCLDCRCRGCRNPNKVVKIEQMSDPDADHEVEIVI